MNSPTPTEALSLCDRCGKILSAADGHRATLGDRQLLLCSVHLRDHGPALEKQKWTIEPLVAPEPVAGPLRRVECGVCGGSAAARKVTASPTSTPVDITQCWACDSRTCNHVMGLNTKNQPIRCERVIKDAKDPICPGGHQLMTEAQP